MCEHYNQHLHLLFLSGELTPDQEEAMHSHHAECESCRLDLQRLQDACRTYQTAGQHAPSASTLATLRLEARRRLLSAWQWRLQQWLRVEWRWLRAAAVAAVILIMAVSVSRLPKKNMTAMLDPFAPVVQNADMHIAELKQRLALLQSGDGFTGQNRSDALIDGELDNIRARMNSLAREMIAD
jgi:hypothetical protein